MQLKYAKMLEELEKQSIDNGMQQELCNSSSQHDITPTKDILLEKFESKAYQN